ncbi:amidohydrolase family protein [Rhodococcus sp. JS3073]|uniref:amidohydrolase family protein n=1 Tax=Rhodococcus sp. JS3073 TaxID=3002901 RepID=UPI0022855B34|nr:amidohydrolase family protein [Rhodococcus sp. JS3073]WAM18973.1 amidohydrolase family protein [Rhodococcus sp. JS3073]
MSGSHAPNTVDLVVRNADWVVTMAGIDIEGGWVACDAGVITAVGPSGHEPVARRTLDARGAIVTPGLVNAHHHLFQNLTRAYVPACASGLEEWLGHLRPIWARLDEDTAYLSAWIGLAELALAGCTTTADNIYLHPKPGLVEASITAATELGMRLDPCRGFVDIARIPVDGAQDEETILRRSEELFVAFHDPSPASRTRISLGPTALAATSSRLLERSAELASRFDARLHLHLFEQQGEAAASLRDFGRRPVDVLVDAGWSGRAWIAHGIYTTEADVAALSAAGIGVAHCPSSNLMLGGAAAPVTALRQAGCGVGLGTDGAASSGLAQPWLEARTALLLAREHSGPAAMTAREALAMATLGGAHCLGRDGEVGALAPGLQADLAVWDTGGIGYAGAGTDPVEAWLRCGPPTVRHTVVAGRPIVTDGALAVDGLEERLESHAKYAQSWQQHLATTP